MSPATPSSAAWSHPERLPQRLVVLAEAAPQRAAPPAPVTPATTPKMIGARAQLLSEKNTATDVWERAAIEPGVLRGELHTRRKSAKGLVSLLDPVPLSPQAAKLWRRSVAARGREIPSPFL